MKKVDKGFEPVYDNLSYRRKFIRTLWWTPPTIAVIIFLILSGNNKIFNMIIAVALGLVQVGQLAYNYIKWQNEKK